MTSYLMSSSSYDMALRTGASTSFGRIMNTGNPKIVNGYILRNTEMTGDILIVNGTEQWLHVTAVNKVPCNGYVAYKIGSTTYCVLTEVVETPAELQISSVTLVPHYSDGTDGIPVEYFPAA